MTVSNFRQANQLLRDGKLEDAVVIYQKAIDQNPEFYLSHHNLGEVLWKLGRLEEAAKAFQKAVELKPSAAWSYFNLGQVLEQLGRKEEALTLYQKASEFNPQLVTRGQQLEASLINSQPLTTQALVKVQPSSEYQQFDPTRQQHGKINRIEQKFNKLEEIQLTIPQRNQQNFTDNVRLIAYYLPQFHPIPENDLWWGKGFTEWTNVSRAQPLFEGHYQPHLPSDLGFYDLRLSEVREAQAELARKYGIYGFCYYYYWFAGKRLLHRPIDEVVASKKPDFPFCICWANENWTRRWDGLAHEVLMAQDHSLEQNQAFAESIVHILRDERYIRINGAPLLIVYRSDILPNPIQTTELWRKIFKQRGIGEVHLALAITCFSGMIDPTQFGFDSAVQFPPHCIPAKELTPPESIVSEFSGHFYDYPDAVINAVSDKMPNFRFFPGTMTSWDNTARRKSSAHAFLNFHPDWYEFWLRGSIEKAKHFYSGDEQLVFINAWNEWAEGAHLEPDTNYGHRYLMATSRALKGNISWKTIVNLLKYFPYQTLDWINKHLDQLEHHTIAQDRSLQALTNILETVGQLQDTINFQLHLELHWNLECFPSNVAVNMMSILFKGWIFHEKTPVKCVEILSKDRLLQITFVEQSRPDVVEAHSTLRVPKNSGFITKISTPELESNTEFKLQAILEDNTCIPLAVISFKVGLQLLEVDNLEQSLLEFQGIKSILAHLRVITFEREVERWNLLQELEKNMQAKEDLIKLMSDFLKPIPGEY